MGSNADWLLTSDSLNSHPPRALIGSIEFWTGKIAHSLRNTRPKEAVHSVERVGPLVWSQAMENSLDSRKQSILLSIDMKLLWAGCSPHGTLKTFKNTRPFTR